MTTVLTGYFRGGDPPTSMTGVDFATPVKGNDPAAAARAGRRQAYGTTGGIAPGMYDQRGSHEVHDGDSETFHVAVVARAAGANGNTTVGTAPFNGVVSSVTYKPTSTITGANTDSRTVNLVNTTNGNAVVATLAFVSGVNAPGGAEKVITLSSTPADLVVAEGDVLQWQSVHVGSTGLADPGGSVSATLNTI